MYDNITLCITMGKRPELLQQTLDSLLQFCEFKAVIAINDFGDTATNEVFKARCPHGTLLNLGKQVGHHAAVDAMYALVKTPYVFHCEDDWLFTQAPNIPASLQLLANPAISVVCYRTIADFHFEQRLSQHLISTTEQGIAYTSLVKLHEQWHGYTFNPHLAKLALWQQANGFSQFKKERHISRWQRSLNHHVAFITPGACHHIGEEISVANPKTKHGFRVTLKAFRKSFKRLLTAYTPKL